MLARHNNCPETDHRSPDPEVSLAIRAGVPFGLRDGNPFSLTPILGQVGGVNPSKTRAIAKAKVKTDKVDVRILAQLLGRKFFCPGAAAR
jgi:transposase